MRVMKKALALLLTFVMMITVLPSMVFAETANLGGVLKFQGMHGVGRELSADYSMCEPYGLTDDSVTFKWSRISSSDLEWLKQNPDQSSQLYLPELSTQRSFTIREEDLGYHMILAVTGRQDLGMSGSLIAISNAVVTAEEAEVLEQEQAVAVMTAEQSVMDNLKSSLLPDTESSVAEEELNDELIEEWSDEPVEEQEWVEFPGENAEMISEPGDMQEWNAEEPSDWDALWDEGEEILDVTVSEEFNTEESVEDWDMGQPEMDDQQNWEELTGSAETVEPVYAAETVKEENEEMLVLDFGSISELDPDYFLYATIHNIGNMPLDFDKIAPEHFMVQDVIETLMPDETVTVWIQPREGLEPGIYEDEISYTTQTGASASFIAKAAYKMETEEENAELPENGEMTEELPENGESSEDVFGAGDLIDPSTVPEPTVEPEPTEEPLPTATPTPVVKEVTNVACDPEKYTFANLTEGYQGSDLIPLSVSVSYDCTDETEAYAEIISETGNFVIGGVPADALAAGTEKSFDITVVPREGLAPGTYADTLKMIIRIDGKEDIFSLISVSVTVEEKIEGVITLALNQSSFNFGSLTEGTAASQTLIITNTGNQRAVLVKPVSEYFAFEGGEAALEPGESTEVIISPKTTLTPGSYSHDIGVFVQTEDGNVQKAAFTAAVNITKKPDAIVKIQSIQNPNPITGIPNGTAKDAVSLKLPTTVVIATSNGEMNAPVTWDVAHAGYDAASVEEQNFTVNGQVTLPNGVQNPDNIPLTAAVNVTVAAYTGKTADPAQNKITGITGGYTTLSRINFTAVGAGMDNASPKKNDTRYLPENWGVVNTYSWEKAPYSASFGMAKAGDYTLTVNFKEQKYNGSAWEDTGVRDVKKQAFRVEQAQITPTSVPGPSLTPGANRPAVNTGDNSPIILLIAALAVAAAAIVGILVYRSKRK